MKNLKMIIVVLLILIGITFSLLPHEIHEWLTFGLNIEHYVHDIIGLVIALIGLVLFYSGLKSTKK